MTLVGRPLFKHSRAETDIANVDDPFDSGALTSNEKFLGSGDSAGRGDSTFVRAVRAVNGADILIDR